MNAGWGDGDLVIGFLLILVIVWIIMGFIGFVVHGLFWLFVIELPSTDELPGESTMIASWRVPLTMFPIA